MENQIIHIDMDNVLCDFMGSFKEHIENCQAMKYPQSQVDFFRSLKPIKGLLEEFQKLSNLPNTIVSVVSAPSKKNPTCQHIHSNHTVWEGNMVW